MRRQALLLLGIALLLTACGSSSPSDLGSMGFLLFVDSGCSCENNPPGTEIVVDGKQVGILPALGRLAVEVTNGTHTWNYQGLAPTTVVVQNGQTVTITSQSNYGCVGGCSTGS